MRETSSAPAPDRLAGVRSETATAQVSSIDTVVTTIIGAARAVSGPSPKWDRIELALREAVANAVTHGA